ncbi:sulfocyanin-like copper-binding protein [Acidithrix ferrooxidans]|uniref:Sulfocyanin-like C-terminal domain-containing protein n=1 Tax=Acidithrix ferrooxidans TaxID=1280514 RepID=A0A0D8HDN2_9ACTN|nr:sulfocyanin-like copper-binding protein [Acidithrix ferrooxidans]KJF16070.1 hypothetical protein AXFE_30910 [Acidithrix ferrooxidans]
MNLKLRTTGFIATGVIILAGASTVIVHGVASSTHQSTIHSLTASGSCQPQNPAAQVVQVGLYDHGGSEMAHGSMMGHGIMMLALNPSPSIVHAGQITFVVSNYGSLNHEFLVLPMPAAGIGTRTVAENGKINESQSLGEASTSCGAGAGSGIVAGSRSWITLKLATGKYELLCDVPWHYTNGMYSSFTVT